ncbi:hypothetical protein FGO68_gene15232 [Halteria grandinella]|uniref:Uncharacterized protein n=1 Tax=Halteria grandinella TaxID=5974 RepID=A0A8J8NY25_HALGN|nr:hypothetical protein FGO68_gene15232 [Halteria grandinella]
MSTLIRSQNQNQIIPESILKRRTLSSQFQGIGNHEETKCFFAEYEPKIDCVIENEYVTWPLYFHSLAKEVAPQLHGRSKECSGNFVEKLQEVEQQLGDCQEVLTFGAWTQAQALMSIPEPTKEQLSNIPIETIPIAITSRDEEKNLNKLNLPRPFVVRPSTSNIEESLTSKLSLKIDFKKMTQKVLLQQRFKKAKALQIVKEEIKQLPNIAQDSQDRDFLMNTYRFGQGGKRQPFIKKLRKVKLCSQEPPLNRREIQIKIEDQLIHEEPIVIAPKQLMKSPKAHEAVGCELQRNGEIDTEKKNQIIDSIKTGRFKFKAKLRASALPLQILDQGQTGRIHYPATYKNRTQESVNSSLSGGHGCRSYKEYQSTQKTCQPNAKSKNPVNNENIDPLSNRRPSQDISSCDRHSHGLKPLITTITSNLLTNAKCKSCSNTGWNQKYNMPCHNCSELPSLQELKTPKAQGSRKKLQGSSGGGTNTRGGVDQSGSEIIVLRGNGSSAFIGDMSITPRALIDIL